MSILLALSATVLGAVEFKVRPQRDDDRVAVAVEKGVTVIDVRSPFGISEATIERTGPAWPETMSLRLHLTGLESFTATCGKAMLHGSFKGGREPRPIKRTVDGKEPPQGPADPGFLDFKALGKGGKPTTEVPLKDGRFELRLPKAFFEANPKSFKREWIDGYRGWA